MALRFKLDENLPHRVVPALRDLGHDVETAISEGLAGAVDPDLLAACTAEDPILVTLDLDFADIRVYPPSSAPRVSSGSLTGIAFAFVSNAEVNASGDWKVGVAFESLLAISMLHSSDAVRCSGVDLDKNRFWPG